MMKSYQLRQEEKLASAFEESRELAEIRERIIRLETKFESMAEVRDTAEAAKDAALHALQAAKSAHHRLGDMTDNQRWLWRTVVGTILAFMAAVLTNLTIGG